MSTSPWHQRSPWSQVPALYVAHFETAGVVKIGKGGNVRSRLRTHAAAGATALYVFPMDRRRIDHAERRALAEAARFGGRIGDTELFTGLSFDAARAIVGKVAGAIGHHVPLANIIGYDHHPRARLQPGINRANGWRTWPPVDAYADVT